MTDTACCLVCMFKGERLCFAASHDAALRAAASPLPSAIQSLQSEHMPSHALGHANRYIPTCARTHTHTHTHTTHTHIHSHTQTLAHLAGLGTGGHLRRWKLALHRNRVINIANTVRQANAAAPSVFAVCSTRANTFWRLPGPLMPPSGASARRRFHWTRILLLQESRMCSSTGWSWRAVCSCVSVCHKLAGHFQSVQQAPCTSVENVTSAASHKMVASSVRTASPNTGCCHLLSWGNPYP
jgi:hypothetical protein